MSRPRTGTALLLLACSLASAGAAVELDRRARALRAQAAAVEAAGRERLRLAQQLHDELGVAARRRLPVDPGYAGPDVDAAGPARAAGEIVRLVALLRAAEDSHGVRWQSLALQPAAPGAAPAAARASDMQPAARIDGTNLHGLDMLLDPVDGVPALRVVRIRAQGEYRSLERLLALMDLLVAQRAALTELALQDDRVTLVAALLTEAP